MAQSGCLPVGSLLITVRRQSATCHCRGGLLSFGSQHNAISSPRLLRPSPKRHAPTCGGSRPARKHQGRSYFHGSKSLLLIPGYLHVRHNSIQSHKGELGHATAKHHSPSRHGRFVLVGRSLSPQPNFAVKPTPTSSACRFPACCALRCGLPVALGLL